jgi:hypothetical protein
MPLCRNLSRYLRYLRGMGSEEVNAFLSHLSVEEKVSA